jgi:iron complex transport system substrate-binding protein
LFGILLLIGILVAPLPVFAATEDSGTRMITDMAGRDVEIPDPVESVITLGSVPVQNSFILALGKGDTIKNNLPESFQKQGRWKYQYVFIPQLADEPSIQVSSNQPNVEQIIGMNPDLCFTMDKGTVELLEGSGVPVIFLSWVDEADVQDLMTLLGEIYHEPDRAAEFLKYFDQTTSRVSAIADTIPDEERKKVLYLNYKSMSVPHKIADWWISTAGGISVSSDPRGTESLEVDPEIVNAWNPDVIIVASESDIDGLLSDEQFSEITAVKNKAIYNGPFGAHIWANRGIELPLMVLWTAKTVYPDHFNSIDLEKETADFYQRFFGTSLTDDQVQEILSGNAKI